MKRARICLAALVGLAVCAAGRIASPASAAVLMVGPDQEYKLPSQAAHAASDGDTVKIEPSADKGGYFDCAVWYANDLTIEGVGKDVTITDKSCQGKALFVTVGKNITIRNLTFQRARVADHNGAGIRVEGANLRVENSRFLNNENGILAANAPQSTITILNSEFVGNGECTRYCAHGIYVNNLALLDIEHSVFSDTHVGHDIKSRAARTQLIGNTIVDGPNGSASYLVDIPNGGSLVMRDNTLEKGPHATNHSTAVTIGEEGVTHPTPEITVVDNKFTNDTGFPTIFVRNITATPVKLAGNTLVGKITPVDGDEMH
jgi:Right handed beta helix region